MKLCCRNAFGYENRKKYFRNVVTPLCPVCADTSFYFLRCEDPVDVLLSEAHNNLIVVSRYAKEQAPRQHSLRALTRNVGQIELARHAPVLFPSATHAAAASHGTSEG